MERTAAKTSGERTCPTAGRRVGLTTATITSPTCPPRGSAGLLDIMPHLHLTLQSGSPGGIGAAAIPQGEDAVLKRMCRQYTVDQFKRMVDSIQAMLDRPAITTDIIVGFPGETDADFEQTLDLARSVGFAKMHVFTFSPRRGTPAAGMQDIVEKGVCRRRSEILRELDIELGLRYRRQFIGETAEVLIESFGVRRPASNVP